MTERKAIGPTFPDEVEAAGLRGLGFSWTAEGVLNFLEEVTLEQRAAVEAVYAAHDPTATTRASRLAATAPIHVDEVVAALLRRGALSVEDFPAGAQPRLAILVEE